VWDYVRNDPEQQGLLDRVLSGEPPR
jgi:hypothetical protein